MANGDLRVKAVLGVPRRLWSGLHPSEFYRENMAKINEPDGLAQEN